MVAHKLAEKAPDSDHVDVAEKLQEVQDEVEKVKEEASDKVLEVEQKYNEKRRPVYLKRNEIIKSILDFWLTAIFKYLSSLDAEDFKDVKSGYAIRFNFNKNPYFEDTKLTKTFSFFDDGTAKIAGTTINWKEGMGVANGKGKQKATGRAKVADVIKEDLWPNPPKYFNNEADEDEFEGDEEENGVGMMIILEIEDDG